MRKYKINGFFLTFKSDLLTMIFDCE